MLSDSLPPLLRTRFPKLNKYQHIRPMARSRSVLRVERADGCEREIKVPLYTISKHRHKDKHAEEQHGEVKKSVLDLAGVNSAPPLYDTGIL